MGGLFGFLTFGLGASIGQQIADLVATGDLPDPRDALKHGIHLFRTLGDAVEDAQEELAEYDAMIEEENAKLKRLLAEAMLDNVMLKDIASKKW